MLYNTIAPSQTNLVSTIEDQTRSASVLSNDDDDYHDAPRIRKGEIDQTDFRNYAVHTLGIEDAEIREIEFEGTPSRPTAIWKKTTEMPRWQLVLLANAFIILLIITFSVVFAFLQSKVGMGQSCLLNSQCNAYVGLVCTAGTCACNTVQFWDGHRCVPQRTFNRTCISQNQCNSVAKLLCMNVTVGLYTDSLCWCSSYRYWSGNQCSNLKTFNNTCSSNGECNIYNFLKCINSKCDCNSTQFWNYEYCENKRSYGQQCFTTYWCDSATQGLQCSTWSPTTGTCDCLVSQYWWSANKTCQTQLPINSTCTSSSQCMTNQSLSCSSSTSPTSCQCSETYWYNSSTCTPRFTAGSACTSSLQCDNTLSLTCNLTAQTCTCNESINVWDGSECVPRRSIGGACSSNSQCLATQNLICATSGVWTGTCACPTNYFWNTSTSLCVLKKLWDQPCATSYECYDGGYLSCQPSAALNATVCDCGNYTYYWTGFLNNTYNGYCTPKINYGVSFNCSSSYQCRDYNYITCISNACGCTTYQYWDGTMCESRLNYSYPCNSTAMCRNWIGGPNLQCLVPTGGSIQQCLCTPTQYFDYCADYCYTAKSWLQPCNTSSCYASNNMCDQSRSLSCISNVCNCSITQWWNTTSCVPKGTYLDSCTTGQTYQCQDYNYLSCVSSQCQCGTTMYWSSSSNYCMSKKSNLGTCASTVECITAAGVGLSCISGQCQCSTGYSWNSVAQQCDAVG